MNILENAANDENDEKSNSEAKVAKASFQRHKRAFEKIRRELRKAQEDYEQQCVSFSTKEETEMEDLEQRTSNQLMRQRAALEDAKHVGYAVDDLANDIKVNLKSQSAKMEKSTIKNLLSIQKDSATSHKLLLMIEAQRKRNKYVLWFVYGLMALACLGILYSLFGWMIPSIGTNSGAVEAPSGQSTITTVEPALSDSGDTKIAGDIKEMSAEGSN